MPRRSNDPVTDSVLRTGVRLRAEVFEEASDRLRRLPYGALRDVADSAYTQLVVVRLGRKYRLQVRVQTTQPDAKHVEVMVRLPGGGRWEPEFVRRFVKKAQR